jgi:hypothetical protein
MNQKLFEELHAQCIVRETRGTYSALDNYAFDSYEVELFNAKLFAELIVRECAKVIEGHDEPSYDGKILLTHFGIE